MRSLISGIIALVLSTLGTSAQTGPHQQQQPGNPAAAGPNDRQPSAGPILLRPLGVAIDATPAGMVITDVFVTLPAYRAGLCIGDILVAINEQPVSSFDQALRLAGNAAMAYVMVDLQRRDMRISRRVEITGGSPESLGFARDGRAVAVTFRRIDAGTLSELRWLATDLSQNMPDTVVVDLRNAPSGSASVAESVAQAMIQALTSNAADAHGLRILVLQTDSRSPAAAALASRLADHDAAQMIMVSSGPFMSRYPGNTSLAGSDATNPYRASAYLTNIVQAPVQWSMADFRTHYPAPDQKAMMHPMMASAPGMPTRAWGINGTAWEALGIARSMM